MTAAGFGRCWWAVRLQPGDLLVRLEVVLPAHLGAPKGGAAIERRMQKDGASDVSSP